MTYDTFTVPVEGGDLCVGRWQGDDGAPTVIAAHGITGSHMSWPPVAEALAGRVTLVAPDLRGRGGSNAVAGPFGMAAHAADLVAVQDHLGLTSSTVVGHSMGGYVVAAMAEQHPERVDNILLIDGGLPLPLPEGLTVDQILQAVIGPARARLEMTFESLDAYRQFWRDHPALGPSWSPAVEAYVDYDVTGPAGTLRSKVSLDAIQADGADTLVPGGNGEAMFRVKAPTALLRAEFGMLGAPPALFPDEVVPALDVLVRNEIVPGTNHYTITLAPHGAALVADVIADLAANP